MARVALIGVAAHLVTGCDEPVATTALPPGLVVALPSTPSAFPDVDRESSRSRFEEDWDRKWDQAKKDFPIPERTPYDHDPILRDAYREAFKEGLETGIKRKGRAAIECFFPRTALERSREEGYQAGLAGPSAVGKRILEEIRLDAEQGLRASRAARLKDHQRQAMRGDDPEARRSASSLVFLAYVDLAEGADLAVSEVLLQAVPVRKRLILDAMTDYGAPPLSAIKTREALKTLSVTATDEQLRALAQDLARRFDRESR